MNYWKRDIVKVKRKAEAEKNFAVCELTIRIPWGSPGIQKTLIRIESEDREEVARTVKALQKGNKLIIGAEVFDSNIDTHIARTGTNGDEDQIWNTGRL